MLKFKLFIVNLKHNLYIEIYLFIIIFSFNIIYVFKNINLL